jgi:hypothetical protein
MRRSLLAVVMLLTFATFAAAGPIVVSGDGNIISDGLNYAGNQTFFRNLLGAGTNVVIRAGAVNGWDNVLASFYTGIGASVSLVGTVTSADLASADLFLSPTVLGGYSSGEDAALLAFSQGGGSIFISGENQAFPTQNLIVNNLLIALGSSMQIAAPDFDYGYWHATGAQILANPLTAGITDFVYAAPSQVTGGNPLFLNSSLVYAFVAEEGVQNRVPDAGSSLLLMGMGLAGLSLWRRR